ncbi:hypothetical protein C2845_PM17G09640 [Panicum miliaceum]|uniref:Uncharacterized protein n=1 Tax=Panicum miliaceum TaxID=4540 RepID=A0A3L6Q146_PANMI|nr:hypothetical protein C2845_PM17G09640 [Panicum miliaceum]
MGNKKQANKGKKDDSPTGDWERNRQYLVGGAGIQFKQGKGKKYIYYSLPTNHSGWRSLWFYIGNHSPALPERTPGKAVWRGEWNEKLNSNQMLQVTELLKLIKEHKDAGVTRVSVLATMYKRRIMPLQKRCRFGFEYLGSNDPSRLTAESSCLPLSKRPKDGGKSGPLGDDVAPKSDVPPGAADPSAVDVAPSPSSSIKTSAMQVPPKEPASGSGKGTARGPRLVGLKKMLFLCSELGDPEEVPAAQAPEQGKSADVAGLEIGAPPPPPPPSPLAVVTQVKEEIASDGADAE